jgi:signal transduction histidine kinase
MNLNFKDRIAFYYMLATAIIVAIVFGTVFFIVKGAVISHLDSDLSYEANKHTEEIQFLGDSILFINKAEWEQREHKEVQVNPVFIQLIDNQGRVMDKSPNLKLSNLTFDSSKLGGHLDTKINDRYIRQVQIPVMKNGQLKGYILAAMSSESSFSVIQKLRNVLLISYFFVLFGLYFVSRFLAGRGIIPVQEMTSTIARITKHNLNERVKLPQNHDEIYHLSSSFNALLERIQKALDREKQFTSDASHELRTPLASLRGTLEVLIRKPRTQNEYEEKIEYSLKEIDRMTSILEQLLMLARLDSGTYHREDAIAMSSLIHDSLDRFKVQILEKELEVEVNSNLEGDHCIHHFYGNIIIDNVLSNAIKYSNVGTKIKINTSLINDRLVCSIQDEGIGINEPDLEHIYEHFYRSEALNHKQITGHGLGLAIVRKCVDAIGAKLSISSRLGEGTTVEITFKPILRKES